MIQPTEDGPWICGGSVVSLLRGDLHHDQDLDVYCRNVAQRERLYDRIEKLRVKITDLTFERQSVSGLSLGGKITPEYGTPFDTPNAATFTSFTNPLAIQIIKGEYRKLEHVFDTFDFNLVKMAIYDEQIVSTPESLKDFHERKLTLDKPTKFILKRLTKYYLRGYTPGESVIEHIARNEGDVQWRFTGSGTDGDS